MRKKKSVTQRVRELVEQGHNNKYIVDKLKCKPQVVYNVRYQANKTKGLGALGKQGTGISSPAPYKPITMDEMFASAPVKMEGGAVYPITMIEPPTMWQRIKGWFRG